MAESAWPSDPPEKTLHRGLNIVVRGPSIESVANLTPIEFLGHHLAKPAGEGIRLRDDRHGFIADRHSRRVGDALGNPPEFLIAAAN